MKEINKTKHYIMFVEILIMKRNASLQTKINTKINTKKTRKETPSEKMNISKLFTRNKICFFSLSPKNVIIFTS